MTARANERLCLGAAVPTMRSHWQSMDLTDTWFESWNIWNFELKKISDLAGLLFPRGFIMLCSASCGQLVDA